MRTLTKLVGTIAVGVAFSASTAWAADFTMKFAMGTGPVENNFAHVPLLAFEKEVEEKSGGRIDVKIYWNFALGKHETVANLVRQGQVEAMVTSEGQFVPFYPDLEVLGIPYLFLDREIAYDVFDGDFGQTLSEDMAKAVNVRPMVWMENGGYRNFSANKPLKTVDDLQGLKMRTMTNPVAMTMVKSLGASPTPIAWADLYTALQTGVVEGQENSLGTFRIPKLEEVQKHIILDGHVYSVSALWVSEKWLQSLPEDLRALVEEAAQNMKTYNRQMSADNEATDRAYLESVGVSVVDVSKEEKARFREMSQAPVIEVLKEKIGEEIVDKALGAAKAAEQAH